MNNDELEASYKEIILKLVKEKPDNYSRMLSNKNSKYKNIYNYLLLKYPKLTGHKFNEYCYWFIHGLVSFPKCLYCGKIITTFMSFNDGYRKYCSITCTNKSNIHINNIKENNIKNHGVSNGLDAKAQEKIKQTSLRKYNVNYLSQSKQAKEKYKQTCLKKYDCTNVSQSEYIKNKKKLTCLKHFGVEWSLSSNEIKQKSKESLLKKYGIPRTPNWTYKYNNLSFDSSWELAYYIWLTDNKIEFKYQPDVKIIYNYNGIDHSYFPDFKVNNELVEIKGTQFFKNQNINEKMVCPYDHSLDSLYEAKHQCMLENHVKILTKIDITPILKYINNKYGHNYLKRFKQFK